MNRQGNKRTLIGASLLTGPGLLALFLISCAGLLAPSCASGSSGEASRGTSREGKAGALRDRRAGFVFPEKFSGLRRGKIRRYRDKRLGYSVGYVHPGSGLIATIFIYKGENREIPPGPDTKVVRRAMRMSIREIMRAGKRGAFSRARVLKSDYLTLKIGEKSVSFRRAFLRLQFKDGSLSTTLILLTGTRNRIFKAYATYSIEDHGRAKLTLRALHKLIFFVVFASQDDGNHERPKGNPPSRKTPEPKDAPGPKNKPRPKKEAPGSGFV